MEIKFYVNTSNALYEQVLQTETTVLKESKNSEKTS